MRRFRRLLKWSAVGLGVGLAAMLVWATVFFDPNDYREQIAEGISEETGLHFTFEGPVRLSLRFEPGEGMFAEVTVKDARLHAVEGIEIPQRAQLSHLAFSFPVTQSVQLADGQLVDGAGQFQISNLDLSAMAVGFGLDPASFNGSVVESVTAEGSFKTGETFVSLTDLKIGISETQVRGDVHLEGLDQLPRLDFSLAASTLNLDEMIPDALRRPTDAFEWLSLSPLMALGISAQGFLTIGTFQSGGLVFEDLTVPIVADGKRVAASPVTATLYDGAMRIDTVARLDGENLDFITRQSFVDVSAGRMLEDMQLTEMLHGQADLEVIVMFSGADYPERLGSAQGVAMLEASEGQIRGFDVASLLSQLSQGDLPSGGQWLGEDAYTALEDVTATLFLGDARLVNDNLSFRAGGLDVAGRGKLDLESELVDYRLLLELDQPEVVRMLPPPLNAMGLILPLRVGGRWDNPGIMIDMPTLIQMQIQRAMGAKSELPSPAVDAQAERVRQVLEAELGKRLDSVIDGAFPQ